MDCVEAFHWALGLISKMLVRTTQEGSTIVIKAINFSSINQHISPPIFQIHRTCLLLGLLDTGTTFQTGIRTPPKKNTATPPPCSV